MKRIIYSSLSVVTAIGTVFVAAKAEVFSQNGSTQDATEQFTAIAPTDSFLGDSLDGSLKDTAKGDLSSLSISQRNDQGVNDLLSGNVLNSGSKLAATSSDIPSGLSSQSKASTKIDESVSAPTVVSSVAPASPAFSASRRSYGQFAQVPVTQVPMPEEPAAAPTAKPSAAEADAATELPEAESPVVPASGIGVEAAPTAAPTIVPASPTVLPAAPVDATETEALGSEMEAAPTEATPIEATPTEAAPVEDESFGEESPVENEAFEAQPLPTEAPDAVDGDTFEDGSIEMEIEEAPESMPEAAPLPSTPLPSAPGTPVPASPDGLGEPVPSAPTAPIPSQSFPAEEPSAPIENVPIEESPIENAPIENAPLEEVPMEENSFPSPTEPLSDSGDRLIGEGFTPFQLSYLAASGGLKEAGIPGGFILIDAYKDGDISAEDVVNAGATTKRLGTAANDEAAYTDSVDDFLKMLVRDARST